MSPVIATREGDILVLTIDNPPVNALSLPVRVGLLAAFEAASRDPDVRAVVLTGANGRFVAGADIKEMEAAPVEPHLPQVIEAIAAFEKPVVAAIEGAALGGGLELAMACDRRVAAETALLGLPETRLGLVPGAGGTQRLPRLTGIARAVEMVAGARILKAQEALEAGVIDTVVGAPLLSAAIEAAKGAGKRRVSDLKAEPGGDIDAASAAALKQTRGNPAIAEAVRLVTLAGETPFAVGLAEERATFLRLRDSEAAGGLRHLFLAERAAAKVPGLEGIAPGPIESVTVIGAGTMGAGIAVALADAGLSVDLIERDEAAAEAGAARVRSTYEDQVAKGRLPRETADQRIVRIRASADWSRIAEVDLVIEAAFEDMSVKREIFARLDAVARPGAILASNTSYLDLDAIAAATSRPQDVVGLHFFAPANFMKLLEIVRGAATSAETLATALAFAKRLGKLGIVAGNCDGFIGNRIFSAYRREAEYLMEDGASPYEIDAALIAYGFPMGVFAVSDLSGLDISHAMRRRRDATRDPSERYVAVADRLFEAGRLGRKSGVGYYSYASGKAEPDPAAEAIVATERKAKGIVARTFAAEEIQQRLLGVMADEGHKILDEGIAQRASDIDLVLVNGYGFPRIKGGPMWAARAR